MTKPHLKSIWETPSIDQPISPPLDPSPVVEQLRVTKKWRNRSWERSHKTVLVRGVPPELKNAIRDVAADIGVSSNEVARACLEFGLQCYAKGEIQLQPVFSGQRLTLFPKKDTAWNSSPGWSEKQWDYRPPAKKTRSLHKPTNQVKRWQQQAAYRGIPPEVQEALRRIYREKHVTLGEVATALLGHALQAYQAGWCCCPSLSGKGEERMTLLEKSVCSQSANCVR